jgi:hypothetical protein
MAFPKLASHFFPLVLPISGRRIEYRGFTTREESALLMAKKVGSSKAHNDAIANVVKIVTDGAIDPTKDSVVDVLFAFLLSRARAVGEISVLTLECPECGKDATVSVDLSKIEVAVPEQKKTSFSLGDSEDGEIFVDLKNLSFTEFSDAQDSETPDIDIFRACVKRMRTDETTIDHASATLADWTELYLSMPLDRRHEIEGFFALKPSAKATAVGKCDACGSQISREITRLSDFL